MNTSPRPFNFHRDLPTHDDTVQIQRINSDGSPNITRRVPEAEAQRILVSERYVPTRISVDRCEYSSHTAGYTYSIIITP